jgi:hypothetical protein
MPTIEGVVAAYRTARDKKTEIEDRHKEELKPIREQMELMERWLMKQLIDTKSESVKTSKGTAYITKTARVKVTDWSAALQHIVDNGLYHVLEQRLSTTQVQEFVEEEQANFPGTEITYNTNVRVRK